MAWNNIRYSTREMHLASLHATSGQRTVCLIMWLCYETKLPKEVTRGQQNAGV